jgi:hypothetical protein
LLPGPARGDLIYRLDIPGYAISDKADGTSSAVMGSRYSLHAGAMAGTDRRTMHEPVNADERDLVFPTMMVLRSEANRTIRVAIPTRLDRTGMETPTGNPVPYESNSPKGYDDGMTKTSGVATAVAGNPFFGPSTVANAEAAVRFSTRMGRSNLTGRMHTFYEAIPQASEYAIRRSGNDRSAARIGSLIIDPTEFLDVDAGDHLIGGLTLTRDGFSVLIDEPGAFAATRVEAGSDFPVSASPVGPLGAGYQDLSLIYTLDVSFQFGQLLNPDVFFDFDPSYQFFNPDDGSELSPGGIAAFVRDRIRGHLTLSGPNAVTLDQAELRLIDYGGTAIADRATFRVDYLSAQAAEVVPEPASAALVGGGAICLLGCAWRRRIGERAESCGRR